MTAIPAATKSSTISAATRRLSMRTSTSTNEPTPSPPAAASSPSGPTADPPTPHLESSPPQEDSALHTFPRCRADRRKVVYGKGVAVSVNLGGRRLFKKKKHKQK